jgi:hypothetical protein
MVDLLFILRIITAVVLLLVTATYLIEFSYRHQNYTKLNKQISGYSNQYHQKYKNLRLKKAANGAYYVGCQRWLIRSFISLFEDKDTKKFLKDDYKKIKDDDFSPTDPVGHIEDISIDAQSSANLLQNSNLWPNPNFPYFDVINREKSYNYLYCTNEWYKWSASRFIPAILTLFFAIVEILFALEKIDAIKGLTYGFLVRIILFLAFGLDVLGVSGDLGISAGIILLVVTLVWIIFFFIGVIDRAKIGAN